MLLLKLKLSRQKWFQNLRSLPGARCRSSHRRLKIRAGHVTTRSPPENWI